MNWIEVKKIILVILGVFLSGVAVSNEKVVLQLKWKHQFQFAGFYAAQKQGYYAEEGLDVDIREVDMSRSASDVVMSGDAQYGVSDSSLVLSRLKGKPLVVLAAIFQHSPLVLLTLESSNIISPLELKNKKIIYRRNVDDAVLFAMFTELGLHNKDYIHVSHTFNDADLMTDKIDAMSAYITNQPFFFEEKGVSVNIISPANYGIDFYGDMIFVDERYLKNNKSQALAFRRASIKGWQYAIDHQEEVVNWILANTNTTKTKAHLLYEAQRTARLIQPELVELGYFSTNRLQRITSLYKKLGLAPLDMKLTGIDYKEYFNNDRLKNKWIYPALIIAASCLVVIFILWIWNQRLKKEESVRTFDLEEVNRDLERYFAVIDKFVVNSSANSEGIITKVSDALCRLSGYSEEELIGQSYEIIYLDDKSEGETEAVRKQAIQNGVWAGEMTCKNKQGKIFWLFTEVEAQVDENGAVKGFTSISVDITDKKNIETLSMTDSLTGLANRRQLDYVLDKELAHAKRYEQLVSVILLDIDHFKQVNDVYGHTVGDEVIVAVADILKNNTRKCDVLGRWGGEEFMVICPNTSLSSAGFLAELLRELVCDLKFSKIPSQSCSFGVGEWNKREEIKVFVDRVDGGLYKAKAAGRNRVELA